MSYIRRPRILLALTAIMAILMVLPPLFTVSGSYQLLRRPERRGLALERAGGPSGKPTTKLEGDAAVEYLKKQGIYDKVAYSVNSAEYALSPAPANQQNKGHSYLAHNRAQSLTAGFNGDRVQLHPLEGK